MKKTKNAKPRTYAYKVVLDKWHTDYLIGGTASIKITRYIIAKNPGEIKKLIRGTIKKKENRPGGPYWDIVSIIKITKKELFQRRRKWLRRISRLATYCPVIIGKRIIL